MSYISHHFNQNKPLSALIANILTDRTYDRFSLPAIGDTDGNRMVVDHEGNWHGVPAEALRVNGARPVENLIPAAGTGSASLAVSSAKTMTLPAGTYIFSMGAGGGTATFSGTGGATGILAANATSRTAVTKTITAGTFIVTASVDTLVDLMVEDATGRANTTSPSDYVSIGVLSDPWHGANCDGFKYFFDTNGNTVSSNFVTEGTGTPLTTAKGYFAEGEATNRLASNTARDFTNVAWTKTNITAAKDATGITGVANSASSLTATAGNGTVFQALTRTSSDHHATFWVKRKTGTGTVEITVDGGSTYTDITSSINSSTYAFVQASQTLANPSIGFRIVTSGDAIEVDYAGCYDTTFSYSPVEGGVTRADDVGATIPASYFSDGVGSIEFELTPYFVNASGSAQGVITTDASAVGKFLYISASTAKAILMTDVTNSGFVLNGWSSIGQTIKVKARWNSATDMDFSVDATAEGGITFDGSFNPSGDVTLFKSLTQGAAISNIKFFSKDLGSAWLQV